MEPTQKQRQAEHDASIRLAEKREAAAILEKDEHRKARLLMLAAKNRKQAETYLTGEWMYL